MKTMAPASPAMIEAHRHVFFVYAAIVLLAISFAFPHTAPLKYCKYICGFVLIPRLLDTPFSRSQFGFFGLLITPALTLAVFAFLSGLVNGDVQACKEAFFFANLVLFGLGMSNVKMNVEKVFLLLGAANLAYVALQIVSNGIQFSFYEAGKATAESSEICFSFGLFFLYFVHQRNWRFALLAMALMFLSFKRIATPAVLLALVPILFNLRVPSRVAMLAIIATANATLFVVQRSTYSGKYQHWIMDTFGSSTNAFFSGRANLYNLVAHYEWPIISLNYGLTFNYLAELPGTYYIWFGQGVRLHNDVIKALIEIGIIPTTCIIVSYFFLSAKLKKYGPLVLGLAIFINLLAYFDNVWVYNNFMAIYMLIVGYCWTQQNHEDVSETNE